MSSTASSSSSRSARYPHPTDPPQNSSHRLKDTTTLTASLALATLAALATAEVFVGRGMQFPT
jgi:hypothetical protein